jgi:parvulin-like peptidyl-prolyl isomerase
MKKNLVLLRLLKASFGRWFPGLPVARTIVRCVQGAVLSAALVPLGTLHLSAAEPANVPANAPAAVLATVDGVAITERQVQRELDRAISGRNLPPAAVASLRDATLKQLIDRRLVAAFMQTYGFGAQPQEIDRQLQRVRKQLEEQQRTLDQYLQQAGLSLNELRDNLAWDIAWPRLLERYLTDENLERYFRQHHRDYDGTEVSVAHILLRIDSPDDPQSRETTIAAARQLREWIQAGELSFVRAAQQYSVAPTAAEAGRLGFIRRREPMPEAFSQAAFALEPETISPPVVTEAGVHLIQCLEIKPGSLGWQDVRAELEPAVTRHLFRWAADRQRPHAKIEVHDAKQAPAD